MDKNREWRSKKFHKLGIWLVKLKLTPNVLTTFSLVCGLLSVYFLFQNYIWFVLFGVLHLFFDAMDGVAARASKSTKFGDYYDHLTDSLITLCALFKIGMYLGDYYAYVVTAMVLVAQGTYYISKQKAPLLFTRTLTLIALILYAPGTILESSIMLVITYLANGVAGAYSLGKQLQWMIQKFNE